MHAFTLEGIVDSNIESDLPVIPSRHRAKRYAKLRIIGVSLCLGILIDRADEAFLRDFCGKLIEETGLTPDLDAALQHSTAFLRSRGIE